MPVIVIADAGFDASFGIAVFARDGESLVRSRSIDRAALSVTFHYPKRIATIRRVAGACPGECRSRIFEAALTGVAEIEDLSLIVARAGFAHLAGEPERPQRLGGIGRSAKPILEQSAILAARFEQAGFAPAPIGIARLHRVLRPALPPPRHRTEIVACLILAIAHARFLVECASSREVTRIVARLRLLCIALRRGGGNCN